MPAAEVEHHVVRQVGDAVADERRPPRTRPAEVLEPLLGGLEPLERRLRRRRVAEHRLLGFEPGSHHGRDRTAPRRRALGRPRLGRRDDLVAELLHEHGELAALVELAVLARQRLGAHRRSRPRPSGCAALALEVAAVEVGDPLPLRVEVDLGLREQHRRAQLGGPAEEVDLRRRQLGRRVGHEDQPVGEGQERRASPRRGRRRGRPCRACRRRRGPASAAGSAP